MLRFIEDFKTRRRVKAFLARDPSYLITPDPIPEHLREWDQHFLLGREEIRRPETMIFRIPVAKGKVEYPKQTVHPALAVLSQYAGKEVTVVTENRRDLF